MVDEEIKETQEEQPEQVKAPAPKPRSGQTLLVFGKYNMDDIEVTDAGLARYINLQPVTLPHSGARHANRYMGKTKVSIVERLVNNMMRTEKYTGKKTKAFKVVEDSFKIMEKKSKTNPIQVLVNAIQNSAPREEVTRLRLGGISVPKAVDIAPARRLDLALRNLSRGAVSSSYKKRASIADCLAKELLLASNKDIQSFAISKRDEMERVSASAR